MSTATEPSNPPPSTGTDPATSPYGERARSETPRRATRLRGRPDLYTSYAQDLALLNTPGKRLGIAALVALALALPFLLTDRWLLSFGLGYAAAIGAIGLNLVTGYAGQVSLGHAFFLGVGAYTGAVLGGPLDKPEIGLGFDLPIALLGGGLVAAAAGVVVAPLALRLRGLYLAIVTLGLVFLGDHIFKEWDSVTGGVGVGTETAIPVILGFRFDTTQTVLGVALTGNQLSYLLALVVLALFTVLARNLARSDVGRAFAAVRDRDIAAEVIGVSLTKHKVLAFTISSFYAGVAGALFYSILGFAEPTTFGLLLSVQYIAMILIGGAGTISGGILGALFVTLLVPVTQELANASELTTQILTMGGFLTVFEVQSLLYGLLIIGFLIFEPRGLFGIWVRTRTYWKGWPFSY